MNEKLLESTVAAIENDMSREAGSLFLDLISDYLDGPGGKQSRVTTTRTPEELADRFSVPFPKEGRPLPEVVDQIVQDVLPDVTRLVNPKYMAVPVAPPLPSAIWTESLIGALNQSNRAFGMSPTATAIELQIVRWLTTKLGLGDNAGGTFTSGGTEANFTALLAARAAILPNAWQDGIGSVSPVVLCGENVHYTVFRAVAQLGLGYKNVIPIPLKDWRMDTDALESHLKRFSQSNTKVMAVVATVGAFGVGAFDNLSVIGELCEAHGVWFHVDGAHGASALLSEEHCYRLNGIEKANSVVWDPHKMMLMPLSASVLLVKDELDLVNAFTSEHVCSLENGKKWNLGTRSFMASRRSDALKVWVALQRYGTDGFGVLYDYLCRLAQLLHGAIESRSEFESLHVPDCNILCFRYVGDRSLNGSDLDSLNQQLVRTFNQSGRGLIATYPTKDRFALRVTIMNPLTREEHLHEMLDDLTDIAKDLVQPYCC